MRYVVVDKGFVHCGECDPYKKFRQGMNPY